jgi:hypothetical protein
MCAMKNGIEYVFGMPYALIVCLDADYHLSQKPLTEIDLGDPPSSFNL